MRSCADCAGVVVVACVNSTSCSNAISICAGSRHPKPSVAFSYGCWPAKTIGSGAGSLVTTPPTMPNSNRWSTASAPCRLEWQPSRWLTWTLHALGPLGAASVLFSEMPRMFAWPLALIALGYGGWLARREARIPRCEFAWPVECPVTLDGEAIEGLSLQWRGPLA